MYGQKLRTGLFIGLLLLCLSAEVVAAPESFGEGAPLLHTELGGQPIAMGGTAVATRADVISGVHNPGNLAFITDPQLGGMHTDLWLQTSFEYIGLALPAGPGTLAINLLTIGSADIPRTDEDGNLIGSFSYRDLAGIISFAHKASPAVAVGASIKYFKVKVDSAAGQGFGLDAGVHVRPECIPGLALGLAVQDVVNSGLVWENGTDIIAGNIRVGGCYQLPGSSLAVAAEYETNPAELHVGAEWLIKDILALRVGHSGTGWSGGVGLESGPLSLDYALADHETLGLKHLISAIIRF